MAIAQQVRIWHAHKGEGSRQPFDGGPEIELELESEDSINSVVLHNQEIPRRHGIKASSYLPISPHPHPFDRLEVLSVARGECEVFRDGSSRNEGVRWVKAASVPVIPHDSVAKDSNLLTQRNAVVG